MSQSAPRGTAVSAVIKHVVYLPFQPAFEAEIGRLHASVFGPGRFARTAFRLRETATLMPQHSFVAQLEGTLIGSVTLSKIAIGGSMLALLGPLAVHSDYRDIGIGRTLLTKSTKSAFESHVSAILLVGDAPYYASAGYEPVPMGTISLPGPVDPTRLLLARNPDMNVRQFVGAAVGCLD